MVYFWNLNHNKKFYRAVNPILYENSYQKEPILVNKDRKVITEEEQWAFEEFFSDTSNYFNVMVPIKSIP